MSLFSLEKEEKVKLFNVTQAAGYMALALKSNGVVSIQVEQISDDGVIHYKNLTPDEMDKMAQDAYDTFELGELEDEFLY